MLELAEPRHPPTASDLERQLELRLIDPDGRTRALSIDGGRSHGFHATMAWRPLLPSAGILAAHEVEVTVVSHEAQNGLGLQVVLSLDAPAVRFMVPGLIYGENRSNDCRLRYPRVVAEDGLATDSLSSHRWGFRADRSSHGAVLGWTDDACLALATDEWSALGLSGLGFCGGASSCVLLNFPAREEPVTYVGQDAPAAPEVQTHDWQADEIAVLRFLVFVLPGESHAYDAVLRCLYRRDRQRHALNPWMPVEDASALVAHGLHRWHYRPEPGVLVETTAFHRDADEGAPVTGDREAMHVGWLSGAPAAHALLQYGRAQDHPEYCDAAVSILDTIASGVAPAGCFWGQWTRAGWDGGWNGNRDWIHARTIGEATLFMIRAARAEQSVGIEHPNWQTAIQSNLEFAVRGQRDDGAFPALVNGRSGAPVSWDGAAGLLWIPALLEGASDQRPAELAGRYYARFVEDEFIFGAPEDIDRAPSSEDGYNAVIAYVALFQATRDARWLDTARRAAEWMLSFRWSYNLTFPEHTLLESYDYRSRGADLASPRNQHLHSYGLICLPELMRLSEHSGDRYYLERAIDNLSASLQFIAREDGDFNARRGMVTERFYNSRCFGPKGALLPVSHAWSAGLVLYACQAGLSLDA
ncbi:MAG TPA: hypothetical protein VIT43_10095 [Candidatus Dormibacteraeota bacterium]